MNELFISALATLFVVIDPIGCAPIYSALTTGATNAQRRVMAIRAVSISALVLLFFAFIGKAMLETLGISLDAFRIAGGMLLFVIAYNMVFEKRTKRREERAEEYATQEVEDVSVFPLAIPMIAGPGSIASIMLLTAHAESGAERSIVIAALGIILLLTMAALIAVGPLLKILGRRVEATITRLLGVILAALSVQYVIDGLRASFNF